MLRFLRGYVYFRAEGGFPETLLSDAAVRGIPVTDSRREGETLYAACAARDYRRLRRSARRACMRLQVYRKQGLPFLLRPYRKRWGLLVGAVLSAVLLAVLSSRIWVVQVETDGRVSVDTAAVLQAVRRQGVYPGCTIKQVDMELLRLLALSDLEDTAFVSVNPSGCVARVTVKPRDMPPAVQYYTTDISNMVAATHGKIVSIEVTSGQAAVQVGEGVVAGDLLISGTVESRVGNLYLRRAAGRVMAETTRTVSVTVPFRETVRAQSGRVVYTPAFRFLKWDVPLYASAPAGGEWEVEVYRRLPQFRDVTLPVGIIDRRWYEITPQTVTYTRETAEIQAADRLQTELAALREAGVTFREETARHTTVTADSLTLTACFLCEENIAKEVPVRFADNSAEKWQKN